MWPISSNEQVCDIHRARFTHKISEKREKKKSTCYGWIDRALSNAFGESSFRGADVENCIHRESRCQKHKPSKVIQKEALGQVEF